MNFVPIVFDWSFRSHCQTVGPNSLVTMKKYPRSADQVWHVRLPPITSDYPTTNPSSPTGPILHPIFQPILRSVGELDAGFTHRVSGDMVPCRHYTLDQRWNEVQNDVTTLFQLHFNVVPMSDARWVWYGVVWCSMVWYGTSVRRYGMVWCGMVWYGMGWHECRVVWHGMVWYGWKRVSGGMVWYGMTLVSDGMVWYGVVLWGSLSAIHVRPTFQRQHYPERPKAKLYTNVVVVVDDAVIFVVLAFTSFRILG